MHDIKLHIRPDLKILFILFSFFHLNTNAQFFLPLHPPVFKNNEQLNNPWTGGLNAPQWSSFDINNDGKKDLFAFDRMGNVPVLFLNNANNAGEINYVYDRIFLKNFPQVENFVLMRDFNSDGIIDLFANARDENLQGIKVFKGHIENGELKFERVLFPEYENDILNFIENDTIVDQVRSWLHINYPVVHDMDHDGDLDILAMNNGGSKIYFYKNIALEKGFTTDTLIYELADDCWGRFGLTADTAALVTSMNNNDCAFFNTPINETEKYIHGGTTLCVFDENMDGDFEILLSDFVNDNIIYGKNNGTAEMAWMNEQDTIFPNYDTPVEIPYFPASFYLDINNDEKKDLLVSPNQNWLTPDRETVWFYENIGDGENVEFNLIQKDFLGDQIIDFGTGATPVFVDVNGDGLSDIVSGNRYYWTPDGFISSLFLLLNIGTETEPAFEITDEDWLGLSQYSPTLSHLYPAFGDLNNDGDKDLLIGDYVGELHFAENTAGANMPMQFSNFQFKWKNIDVGDFATPFIYDINMDGLNDLIIGELKGTINYFPNIGTLDIPDFHPIAEEAPNNFYFGKISTQPFNSTVGYSQPNIVAQGDSLFLITGSLRGWIKKYLIDLDSLDGGSFELLEDEWDGLREGLTTRISFTNLNNDKYLDAVIGNDRGGLAVFQSPVLWDGFVNNNEFKISEKKPFELFPNPTKGEINLILFEKMDVGVYDILGREVFDLKNLLGNNMIDLSGIEVGVYFIKIYRGESLYLRKIILSK